MRTERDDVTTGAMPDKFDRMLGQLDGLPGMAKTKPTTIRTVPPLGIGGSETFIIQTFRQAGQGDEGDDKSPATFTVFVEAMCAHGVVRLVLPAAVADVIVRQRDALSGQARTRAAKAAAATRKAKGFKPTFGRTA